MKEKYEYVFNEGESITCDECDKVSTNEWRVNYYHAICEECYFNYHAEADGQCDTCGISYDIGSQFDHCGKCGNCFTHCQCENELERAN